VVQTVPVRSVITDWDTYVFTVFAVTALAVTVAACLLVLVFRRARWTLVTLDVLLVSLAVATATVLCQRLVTMERATNGVAADGYVDLKPACLMHVTCEWCVTALAATALLKLSRPRWPHCGRYPWAVAIVALAAISVLVCRLVTLT
jgi:hypothetical protein